MRLPLQFSGIQRTSQGASIHSNIESLFPAEVARMPQPIALVLARDHAIETITGSLAQCIGTITGILSDYDRCTERGGVLCENIAARQIATIACRSYCTCGR